MTREEWLNTLTDNLRPLFSVEVPENIRVTCGWPSQAAKAEKNRRIGECWSCENSEDKHFEIFISPLLDAVEAAGILVHEMVHAIVGIEEGHKGLFRTVAMAVGLEGKMTATVPGAELAGKLREILAGMPPYPHGRLTFTKKAVQGTRMLKVLCPICGYQVRTTQKWLEVGTPTCPCGEQMEAA